ncbi:MAG: DUF2007 domain-containing protein, partial [Actinomycetia bacterium]|nr:DUF2007 domain-containing protein [Actinomycetes bacterium]
RLEAEFFRGLFKTAGIEAILILDDAGGMYPELSGARILVSEEDAEEAKKLLES